MRGAGGMDVRHRAYVVDRGAKKMPRTPMTRDRMTAIIHHRSIVARRRASARVRAMSGRLARFVAAAALQVVALVLAHELVYLARYGSRFGEALVHGGHGDAWSGAVMTSLVLAVGLALLATARLAHLALLVRRAGGGRKPHATLEPRLLLRIWLRTGPRLAVLGVVLLTIQENVERAAIGGSVTGPALLLSPEYAGGLWIALAVGLAVGLVAALFEWRSRVLLARLRTQRQRLPKAVSGAVRRPGVTVAPPAESLLGRRSALRAPPLRAAS
jgi:hypothetical protein